MSRPFVEPHAYSLDCACPDCLETYTRRQNALTYGADPIGPARGFVLASLLGAGIWLLISAALAWRFGWLP